MTSDEALQPPPRRGYVRFSAKVARAVCVRIAAGETQRQICADPAMPCTDTLRRWARDLPAFARIFARARALGGRDGTGRPSSYCPATAHEIVVRVSEGESLTAIAADPAMPPMRTIFNWRTSEPEFAERLRMAREALAERFSDLGWKLAMEATPETAHLTRVRLAQLRWTAAMLAPRTYGRLKPTEPPEPAVMRTLLVRDFQIETHPETGQRRVVGYRPDPQTLLPTRVSEGPWTDPPDPVAKLAAIEALSAQRKAAQSPVDPDDPEGWR